ncbi:aryl hydrocarbon receptor 1b [Clarias gariepinus]|uniref:aryl hydrocarbon receptor 1b n=1 Tax=Clarias gariepinus TaxID=13013 RepID=UPI00234CD46A|nr:aryl hydrocarbon receptor 1b [Clarias gariepinus]
MYAGRKRRKAVQKAVKQPPADGVKSNPSKRHRDRLNSELDRLARLLPFPDDVTSGLDKLSILRLSVSFLRTKTFFSLTLKNHGGKRATPSHGNHGNSKATGLLDGRLPEGELLLQALNGFVLVVTSEGTIFYVSHTIQDYLGFHQTDVLHQCVFELVHTEDQQAFRRNLHWALNPPTAEEKPEITQDAGSASSSSSVHYKPDQLPPENSSFLERNFICRFRCLLDNSSGFLALNLQGRLKFLHGQNRHLDDGGQAPPHLALFAVATPLQLPSILEIRTKNMIFRTKHKLDFTPMACDAKGKIVLGYTEAELRVRGTGYQFIHAADMLYCAENHVRMIKTGESGLTVFRLLTKENRWKWVQANARLVYKNGKPDYIIATQRPLGEEEGGEHLRKRSMHLPFTFATGEALLYQTSFPIPGFSDNMAAKGKSGKSKKTKVDKSSKDELDPSSLLGAIMRQDKSVYVCQPASDPKVPYRSSLFSKQEETSTFSNSVEGLNFNSAPNNENGVLKSVVSTSFDPLLATLDSLSLENEESCTNTELFNALENLGLNAEDLELLLLDERMIQVEMEPEYIPSLNDLLTNNEILSYIHDSIENSTTSENSLVPLTASDLMDPIEGSSKPYNPPSMSDSTPIPVSSPYLSFRPSRCPTSPILHLSQQMQQHLSTQVLHQKYHGWIPETQISEVSFPQHNSLLASAAADVQNGHCFPQQTLDEVSEVNVKFPEPNKHQEPWCQNQTQSLLPYKHEHMYVGGSQNGIGPTPQWEEPYYIDHQAPQSSYVDYNMAMVSGMEFNGRVDGELRHGMSSSSLLSSQQLCAKQTISTYTYTNQNSSLGHVLPSLDVYKMFDSTQSQDSTHRQVRSSKNLCLMPK